MGINKVQYGNTTLIDLTSDTVTADKLMQGYTAHDRTGAIITGTATGGGSVTQDQDGFIVLPTTGGGGSPSVGGLEYEEGTYTTAEEVLSVDISFSNTHTNVPFFVGFVDTTGDYNDTLNTGYAWWYFDWHELFGKEIYYNSTSKYYGYKAFRYRSSSTTTITGSVTGITAHPDTANLTNAYFHVAFTGNYLRPNRTYKWIAVWAPTT